MHALIRIVLLSAAVSAPVSAAGLRLDQALVKVLENHPQLKIADYEARAIAARIKIAAQRPADKVRIEAQNFAGSGEARWLGNMETTLSLARVLELGDKSAFRTAVATQEAHLLRDRQAALRLDLLTEAARRFLRVALDQERLLIAAEAVEQTRKTRAIVASRIQAGVAPLAERHRIDIDLAQQELELEDAEHELASAKIRLAALWNDLEAGFAEVSAALYTLARPPAFETYAGLLERNPDLIRFNTRQRLAEARLRLAGIRRKPDIELNAGLRYLGASNDIGFVLSASLPLGSARRAAPAIEEAELLSRIDPLALEQQRAELSATLYALYQELLHSRTAAERLEQHIIPTTARAVQEYEKLYDAGRLSLLELVEAQRKRRHARRQLLESAYHFHRLQLEIDRLTGAPALTGEQP